MKRLTTAILLSLSLICATFTWAGNGTHYPNGVEGIRGSTLPPPGFYYRMYNVYYQADELKGPDGDEIPGLDFEIDLYCMAHRFIWVSKHKILGADFFVDLTVPVLYKDISVGGMNEDDFGIGDPCLEPFGLAWHGDRYDAAIALGVYLPIGDYSEGNPLGSSPGLNYWTGMLTAGVTWYFDPAKTWSGSILARYETHGENDHLDWEPGDDFHFEWGIGKKLARFWEVGVAGYCQWQVTEDSGTNANDDKDQVYAAGPEINYFVAPIKTNITFRYLFEFEAEDRSEGDFATLIFTYIF